MSPEENEDTVTEQVISVGEAAYLKHLEEMKVQMEHQTQAMGRIANALELMFSRICLEIDEAKAEDGN